MLNNQPGKRFAKKWLSLLLIVICSTLASPLSADCTPAKCGVIFGNVDVWCCGDRCAALLQVTDAEHGIYLGEIDGC